MRKLGLLILVCLSMSLVVPAFAQASPAQTSPAQISATFKARLFRKFLRFIRALPLTWNNFRPAKFG